MASMDKDVSDIIKDMMMTNSAKDGLGFLVSKFKVGYLVVKFSSEAFRMHLDLDSKKGVGVQSIS